MLIFNLICFLIFSSLSYAYPHNEESKDLQCTKENEEISCVFDCPPEKSCHNRLIAFSCARNDDDVCTNKCLCKEGFFRNANGDCVTLEYCEKCSGQHEYFECGGACDNECETLHLQNKTDCPILNIVCNQKCYCEDGYARNENNECVKITQCKSPKCPGPNEYYSDCTASCPPETCMSLVARFKCPEPTCTSGCKCRDGYLRLEEGEACIPINKCPQLGNV